MYHADKRTLSDHPRIRGEHLSRGYSKEKERGSSPHTRGARTDEPRHRRRFGIIPAYAGSTYRSEDMHGGHTDHPRIRGEHGPPMPVNSASNGSSPHTRGALVHWSLRSISSRIIPAYAGSTRADQEEGDGARDHPRIRGEHAAPPGTIRQTRGSSPHTRGARPVQPRPGGATRIIPAYAGSTRARRRRCAAVRDHPRIRGEHH